MICYEQRQRESDSKHYKDFNTLNNDISCEPTKSNADHQTLKPSSTTVGPNSYWTFSSWLLGDSTAPTGSTISTRIESKEQHITNFSPQLLVNSTRIKRLSQFGNPILDCTALDHVYSDTSIDLLTRNKSCTVRLEGHNHKNLTESVATKVLIFFSSTTWKARFPFSFKDHGNSETLKKGGKLRSD